MNYIILYNSFDLYNRAFDAYINYNNSEKIDWYREIEKREKYLNDGYPTPGVFPCIVEKSTKRIFNEASSLNQAEEYFTRQQLKDYPNITPAGADWSLIRKLRNILLNETDWTQSPDSPISNRQAWADYRQELRDITKNFANPQDVVWPPKPA